MDYYLAQVNIAKMLAPLDTPLMADFVDNLDRINTLAEKSKGFVWRLVEAGNNATSIHAFDDTYILINMSVWESAESLFNYVYDSGHLEIFKRRKEWFSKMKRNHMALWYIKRGTIPNLDDAKHRLKYLETHGESPYAFTFKSNYTPMDAQNYEGPLK